MRTGLTVSKRFNKLPTYLYTTDFLYSTSKNFLTSFLPIQAIKSSNTEFTKFLE